ncbi:MAG TPA: hypothetical protein VFJ90_06260 [Candidatus Didemnitutus sp.]|nr:hypothetical protein [Candidatus Didemnitutus sp.]
MPFKFDSPEGRMEITVRPAPPSDSGNGQQFGAAATFLQSGSRALERIKLAANAPTHTGVMRMLTSGFKVNPGSYEDGSIEYRVLTALCAATGVVEVDV